MINSQRSDRSSLIDQKKTKGNDYEFSDDGESRRLFSRFPWLFRYIPYKSRVVQMEEAFINDALLERTPQRISFEFVEFAENIFLLDEDGNILKYEFSVDFKWWKPRTWSGRHTVYGRVGRRSTVRECLSGLKEEGKKLAFILSEYNNSIVVYKK